MTSYEESDLVSPFWTQPEHVDSFANRDPDKRLVALLESIVKPGSSKVLDLGCAGGRNTVVLATRQYDFIAMDASRPMVARTRERVERILGVTEARRRVRFGSMEDLSIYPDGSFDLIVALGVYHQSTTLERWHRAIAESGRVLSSGGLVLISAFTPDSKPDGKPLIPKPGHSNVYEGFASGPLCLFGIDAHDKSMARFGMEPDVQTEAVRVKTDLGYRVTLNALYRKTG